MNNLKCLLHEALRHRFLRHGCAVLCCAVLCCAVLCMTVAVYGKTPIKPYVSCMMYRRWLWKSFFLFHVVWGKETWRVSPKKSSILPMPSVPHEKQSTANGFSVSRKCGGIWRELWGARMQGQVQLVRGKKSLVWSWCVRLFVSLTPLSLAAWLRNTPAVRQLMRLPHRCLRKRLWKSSGTSFETLWACGCHSTCILRSKATGRILGEAKGSTPGAKIWRC